jgi:uncharacterized protein
MSRTDLDAVLAVQSVDSEIDTLTHRRAALPERAELERVLREGKAAHDQLTGLRAERDALSRAVKALDDKTETVAAKARSVDEKLYSGTVTSPRELQDLQADLDSLRQHQRELEDQELEQMELAERLDREVGAAEEHLATMGRNVEALRAAIGEAETEIDARIAELVAARGDHTNAVSSELLADYERRRSQNRGVGAAALVGDTCQGCRLTVPATEVDEIHHDTTGRVFACDNCGAILVPR